VKEEPKTYGDMSDDPFAVILASVVNDPGIRETSLVHSASMVSAPTPKPVDKPVALKETKPVETKPAARTEQGNVAKVEEQGKPDQASPKEAEPVMPAPSVQTSTLTAETDNKPTAKTEVAKTEAPAVKLADEKKEPAPPAPGNAKYAAKQVEKISELKTWTGYQLMFIDHSGPKPDTITVVIDDTVAVQKSDPSSANNAVTGNAGNDNAMANNAVVNNAKAPRTDCRNMAREKDVLALRKKMLTLGSDAEMVDIVVKEARNKCFTVEQLQNLSYVFVNDDGRVLLFELAYPYIFDPANYKRLETQLSGEEQLSRFRNLIK
jgi:hypothetical protein